MVHNPQLPAGYDTLPKVAQWVTDNLIKPDVDFNAGIKSLTNFDSVTLGGLPAYGILAHGEKTTSPAVVPVTKYYEFTIRQGDDRLYLLEYSTAPDWLYLDYNNNGKWDANYDEDGDGIPDGEPWVNVYAATRGAADRADASFTIRSGPLPQNEVPIADAGANQTVEPGDTVILDGTKSRDVDGTTITSYSWALVSYPILPFPKPIPSINLQPNNSASRPTFTAPQVVGNYILQLVVTDGLGATSIPDNVVVRVETIVPPVNKPPIALTSASPQNAEPNERVTLDGSSSSDPDKGPQPLKYSWTVVSGPTAGIVLQPGNNVAKPTFIAPAALESSLTLRFKLVVNDGQTDSAPAYSDVTVSPDEPEDNPPVIDVPPRVVEVPVENRLPTAVITLPSEPYRLDMPLTFSGESSNDPDGSILAYLWDFGDGTTDNGITVTHTYKDSSNYNVKLEVTDNRGGKSQVTEELIVLPKIDERPVINVPSSPIQVNTTSPSGALVEYQASVTDDVDSRIIPNCTPASGSTFQIGDTTVRCRATDSSGNSAFKSFYVVVQHVNNPPVITGPSTIPIEVPATNNEGAEVSYTVTASDREDGNLIPTCDPPSGSIFRVGETIVRCSIRDIAGTDATLDFPVIVQSPDEPLLIIFIIIALAIVAIVIIIVLIRRRRRMIRTDIGDDDGTRVY
jgi:PKD repeat protein